MANPELNPVGDQRHEADDVLEEDRGGVQAEVLRLRQRIQTRDEALRTLGRRLAVLEAGVRVRSVDEDTVEGYERRIGVLSEELTLQSALLEDRDRDLTRQLEEQERGLNQVTTQLEERNRDLIQLTRNLTEVAAERDDHRRHAGELAAQVAELGAQVQALRSLRILRYTTPIRDELYRLRRRRKNG